MLQTCDIWCCVEEEEAPDFECCMQHESQHGSLGYCVGYRGGGHLRVAWILSRVSGRRNYDVECCTQHGSLDF
jgi:hypothetical protein